MKYPPLLALLLLLPLAAPAQDAPAPGAGLAELNRCIERNVPEPTSIRAVRIASKDRVGQERETLVKIYGRRSEKGLRQVLVEFLEPEDVAGSSFLMLQTETGTQMYFRSSKDAKPKRVSGASRSLALFGSDFSYEDFEHLFAFRRPEASKRLDDDEHRGRPVYVVETRSSDSMYDRIITSIDKERCVAIRAELYEKGRGLRKELTINPRRVVKKGGVWIPQVAVMNDLRDLTSTMFLVDSTEQDVVLDESLFRVQPAVAGGP